MINQLTGRDLDAAIAERLFGFGLTRYTDPLGTERVRCDVPSYSSDWNAMRLVVEEMKRRGWWCHMASPFVPEPIESEDTSHLWCAGFFPNAKHRTSDREHYADTLPEAVARAAIRAIEGEGK